jgi:ketosteroid isomerase-like protein
MTRTDDVTVELVARVNRRDEAALQDLFAPTAELQLPDGRMYTGHEQLHGFYRWMIEALPTHTLAVNRIRSTDGSSSLEFEAAGKGKTGTDFDTVGAALLDVEDDHVQRIRLFYDAAALSAAAGAGPAESGTVEG